ncbi:MAG: hypothetical protein C3F11_00465 [Methylocystaceae bacterium]|nr:MAG: hypothetical protein C3F11_00465 [Methylocystaceae bacterium]
MIDASRMVTIAAIEGGVPLLVEARAVIATFQAMIRKKAEGELDGWIERARTGVVASFASGVVKDRVAVAAASSARTANSVSNISRIRVGRQRVDVGLAVRIPLPQD